MRGIKLILDAEPVAAGEGSNGGSMSSALELKQKDLEKSSFQLVLDELDYDVQSYRVFKANSAQHESAAARQMVSWAQKLAEEASKAADTYLQHHASRRRLFMKVVADRVARQVYDFF